MFKYVGALVAVLFSAVAVQAAELKCSFPTGSATFQVSDVKHLVQTNHKDFYPVWRQAKSASDVWTLTFLPNAKYRIVFSDKNYTIKNGYSYQPAVSYDGDRKVNGVCVHKQGVTAKNLAASRI